ncbi:PAS domain S-box protein [Nannocystis exedens]|uniref:PAS domain S-box protein n=1 Tax=Nannocystis exedens TaxID=54 RepID=UPI00147287A9|nr:PAS domain S-box protein [Nannocystis exedens]
MAVAATATAVLARLALAPSRLEHTSPMLFVPAVLAAAAAGGLWPGLLAWLLSVVAAMCFLDALGRPVRGEATADWLQLVLFTVTAVYICCICERLYAARHDVARRAAEELRKRTEEIDRLMELMPAVAWFARDAECRVVVGNKQGCQLMGAPAGCNVSAQLPPEQRRWLRFQRDGQELPIEATPMRLAIATGAPVTDAELDLVLIDGTTITLLGNAAPLFDAAGSVRGAAAVCLDITGRKRFQEKLHESEERLRLAMEGAELGEWEINLLTGAVVWSPRTCEIFGLDPDTPVTLELYRARLHPEDRAADSEALRASLVSGVYESEYRIERPDGGCRWVSARGKTVRDRQGRPVRTLGVVSDITPRKAAELARARSEERLRLIIESARDYAIFTTDPRGIVTSWNAGAKNVLGYDEQEIVGEPSNILFTAEERNLGVPEQELRVALAEGRAASERWHLRKDGSRFWGSGVTVPLRDHGDIRGFLKILRDRTDAQQAKRLLEREAEALQQADRRKDEFLATLAHELRNPLAPLSHGLEILRRAGDDQAVVERARAMMERQLGHMVHLIDDLLDVSRICSGRIELRTQRVALAEVLRSALEAVQPLIEGGGHELTMEGLPEPVFVVADVVRLAQVFANLLGNAAKFTPHGGHIRLTVERQGGDVLIRVKDDGIGIRAEMLPRVFDLFTQANHSLERSQGGLGIGLSLVKSLVELHGGAVEARSDGPDLGSEFVVRLPTVEPPPDSPAEPLERLDRAHARRRVLVVDDNQDAAVSLADILELMGCDTRVVHDGLAALRAAPEFRPDLVFLDIGMPDMNGYETARRIRQEPWGKALTLVALTGWGQEGDKARARDAGFDHHLVKPAAPQDLEDLLAGRT